MPLLSTQDSSSETERTTAHYRRAVVQLVATTRRVLLLVVMYQLVVEPHGLMWCVAADGLTAASAGGASVRNLTAVLLTVLLVPLVSSWITRGAVQLQQMRRMEVLITDK